jgi:uncharacterized membrane protein YkvA (DUF1232 family)
LGLGLLDDAVVIGYVFSIVGAEVSNFEDWLAAQQSVAPKPVAPKPVAQKDRTSP